MIGEKNLRKKKLKNRHTSLVHVCETFLPNLVLRNVNTSRLLRSFVCAVSRSSQNKLTLIWRNAAQKHGIHSLAVGSACPYMCVCVCCCCYMCVLSLLPDVLLGLSLEMRLITVTTYVTLSGAATYLHGAPPLANF